MDKPREKNCRPKELGAGLGSGAGVKELEVLKFRSEAAPMAPITSSSPPMHKTGVSANKLQYIASSNHTPTKIEMKNNE